MSRWRDHSRQIMTRLIEQGQREGKTPAEILKAIDDAYPFGTRELHPYKMWLKERREAMLRLGITPPRQPAFQAGPLFGGEV